MAVEIKIAPDEKLELVRAQIIDNSLNSDYFNVTELSDTFSGGKNAFLIAGSELLEPNTEVKVQIRDSAGEVLYLEFSDGYPTEYYEGISKVVAVYVYPTVTTFGPATITLIGQIKDSLDLVKWERKINIDPSLPNTTRVRFYKRPKVSIVEQLAPIYSFDVTGSKVASNVTQSFANIKVSQLDTFAGDVKRVKVYRTSKGDISDYDLIQDILVESKELLTTTALSGSVVGEAGLFTSETLKKLWNTGSLNVALTSSRIDNGLSLKGSGYLRYTGSLNLTNGNTYELGIDAFYSSSTKSDMGIYVSGSQNGATLVGTLNGVIPTKNLKDQVYTFTLDKAEPTASLYLSQSQSEWHVGNISLKLSEDSAFSPSEISFVTSMPTVIGNETYNFKFEFYDVNNNYVPVAVTQSALFTGGNNNINGTLILISGSISASEAGLLALSQSVSGTIGVVTGSVSQSFYTASLYSASLQSSSLYISASVSGTISNVSQSVSGTISLVSQSFSSSLSLISASTATTFSDVNSRIFTDATGLVNKAPSTGVAGLYTGNSYMGFHNGNGLVTGWKTYMANNGNFFLTSSVIGGGFLAWDSAVATLQIKGAIDITGGTAQTQIQNAALSGSNAFTSASAYSSSAYTSISASNAASLAYSASISASTFYTTNLLDTRIFTDSTGKIVKPPSTGVSGLYLGSSYMGFHNGSVWKTYMDNLGKFYLTGSVTDGYSNYLTWDGAGTLTIAGSINITGGAAATQITNAALSGSNALSYAVSNNATASAAAASAAANYALINANTSSISAAATAAGYALINANTASIFTDSTGKINKTPATGTQTGLFLGQTYMGYYNGSAWKTYMQNNGNFYLTGTNGYLSWNATADTLGIKGDIIATNITATSGGNIAGWITNATAISKAGISLDSATPEIRISGSVSKVKLGTRNLVELTGTDDQRTVYLGQGGVKITGDWDVTNSEYPSYITLAADSGFSKAIFFNKNVGYSSELVYMYALPYGAGSCLRIENGGARIRNYDDGSGYTGTGNGGYALQVGSISGTTATFTGDVTANTSDGRLKTNIKNIDSPLEKISKINGVYFNWNEKAKELNEKDPEQREVGFIAQEIKEVMPEIVKRAAFDTIMDESITDRVVFKSKSGEEYLTIQYEKIVPLLVEAIKELKNEIEELKKNR